MDTNGAGDAFVGGFLSQLFVGNSIEQAIDCGIYLSQEICKNYGAAMPTEIRWNEDKWESDNSGDIFIEEAKTPEELSIRSEPSTESEKALKEITDKENLNLNIQPDNFFDYETLKSTIPKGVHPTQKHMYLSETEFEKVFEMNKEMFQQLKPHKQKSLKKNAGLFWKERTTQKLSLSL